LKTTETSLIRSLVRAGVVGLLLGPSLVLVGVTVAHAYPSDCPSRYQEEVQNSTNGRGVRENNPGMLIKDTTVYCARASTMAVVSSDELNFVEWGWYEQEHPSGNGWICIDTNGPSTLVTTQTNGVPWCKQTIRTFAPSVGEWWYWALSDPLLDGNWTFRYLTTDYYMKNMGTLTTGQVRLNAERKSLSDTSNHAEFLGAQRMGHDTYGNPVWRDFGTVTAVWASDPNYHYCYYNTGYDNVDVYIQKGPC
jgi:hypothetical protein